MLRKPDNDGRILALDVATELGWCLGKPSDRTPVWGSVRFEGGIPNCLVPLGQWLGQQLRAGGIDLVVFEAPPALQWAGKKTNAQTLLKLNSMCVKVEEVCAQFKIACRDLAAQRWKTALCGPLGRARFGKDVKPYPPFEALALRGWTVLNHNAADAVGIWLFTVGRRAPELALQFDPLVRRAGVRRKR